MNVNVAARINAASPGLLEAIQRTSAKIRETQAATQPPKEQPASNFSPPTTGFGSSLIQIDFFFTGTGASPAATNADSDSEALNFAAARQRPGVLHTGSGTPVTERVASMEVGPQISASP
ncbi:MAG: hypothetical protein R3194_00920, partial [Limnobacter sp.]|nr:hypothetical protein [Limnobacter sp.]